MKLLLKKVCKTCDEENVRHRLAMNKSIVLQRLKSWRKQHYTCRLLKQDLVLAHRIQKYESYKINFK